MKKIAIIDQGTSSSKLHIFSVDNSQNIEETFRKKIETRLGANMALNGNVIEEEGLKKTIQALLEFKEICKKESVESIEIISTEVLRKAKNTQEIINKLKTLTNLNVEVLTQEDEAQMFWYGATKDFTWEKKIAAIDIGGGSVQFMYGTKEKLEGHELLKTGTIHLRNSFFQEDTPTREEYKKLEKAINEAIAHMNYSLPEDTPLIHGSTSVLNLYREAKVKMESFAYSKSHPLLTKLTETERLYKEVRLKPKKEREKYFPSEPSFMDGLCPGLANVLLIAKKLRLAYELPSNFNIIQGIALQKTKKT